MKSTLPTQTRKVDRLQCDQCGHECSRSDFTQMQNLCEHLALDALAAAQSRREQRTLSSRKRHRPSYQNALAPYPCWQRLMGSNLFFDVEIHARFEEARPSHVAK